MASAEFTGPPRSLGDPDQDLRAIVRHLSDSQLDKRDRALLLVGFAGALRRGELVALEARDVEFTVDGLAVTLQSGKRPCTHSRDWQPRLVNLATEAAISANDEATPDRLCGRSMGWCAPESGEQCTLRSVRLISRFLAP